MKRFLLWLIAALLPLAATAQQHPLSDGAAASIITCGPGNDFYLAFGHSAIRIQDTTQGIDYVYNYGTFDFGAPHFYWNFARGMLNYCLSRTSFRSFMATYDYERRAVWEQRLNLTAQEVNNLFVMLEWNYLPANRYYRYDFFRDNCATRVRDMVESAAGHTQPAYSDRFAGDSYRRYVHRSAGSRQQWWMLGVDLLLGLPADHRCDARELMFHPIHMMNTLDGSTRAGAPLVQPAMQYLTDQREPLHRSLPPTLAFALLLVAAAVLTLRGHWRPWMDRVLLAVAGLAGLVLCFMWFGTDHWCTRWNLNILWLSPLLLLIALRLERSPRWALWLQVACFAVAAVWAAWCGLSPAIQPIIYLLALRVVMLLRQSRA